MKRVLLSFISFFMLFAIAATAQTQDLGYNTALAGRVCDSAMVQQWNGTAWQLAGYQVYRFTNSGLVSEYRTYGTNGLTEQMLYNRNSSNMTTTISDLSNVNGTMQSAYQILLGYNTAGKITSETVLSPDSATMGYDSSYRILNAYDASNYLTSQTLQAYYGGMWMNFENLAYTNNSAGFPTSVLQQSWDMMNNAWTTSARETYTLNSDNTVASILQETNTATSGSPIWANQQRTTYGTYAYGRPSYTLTENWDDANSAWIGSTLDSVTNAREISYNYTNGGWEPNQLITCSGNAPLTQPSAPVSLTAAPNGNGSITLNWSMGSNMGTGYNVYRSTDTANASSWTKIGTAASTATSYVDSNLSKNVTYYYRITAYNSLYESGYSNVASAVILTGISAAHMPLLSLYPNPANSALILENNGAAGQYVLSITDLMGREIIHQNLKDPSARINVNVEALAAGMYNVILKSDSEVRTARVMISR